MELQTNIVDFIKTHYPKIVFKPYKFAYKKAIGFIITDNQLLIGYINKNGTLCKLMDPIDIQKLSKKYIPDILDKIPLVEGFTEGDKQYLINFFKDSDDTISKKEHNEIVKQLKQQIKSNEVNYKTLYDSASSELVSVKKEYEDKINKINNLYEEQQRQYEQCKNTVIEQKQQIVKSIKEYEDKIKEYIKGHELEKSDIQTIYDQVISEKEDLQNKLNVLIESEKKHVEDLANNQKFLELKDSKIIELEESYRDIVSQKERLEKYIKELIQKQKEESEQQIVSHDQLLESQQICEKIDQENVLLQNKIKELMDNQDIYIKKLKSSDLDKEAVIKQLNNLQEMYTKIENEKENLKSKVESLISMQKEKSATYENIEAQLLERNNRIIELESQYKILEEDHMNLINELENIKKALLTASEKTSMHDELSKQYLLLQDELQNKNIELENTKLELENLQTTFVEKNSDIQELQNQYKDLLQEKQVLSAKIEELNTVIENINIDKEENIQKYEELKNQYDDLRIEYENKNAELEGVKQQIVDSQIFNEQIKQRDERIVELEKIYQQIINENSELKTTVEQYKNYTIEIEDKLSNEEKKSKDLLIQYNTLDQEWRERAGEYEKLEETIRSINEELERTKDALNKSELQNKMIEGYTNRCQQQFINNKELIISKIKEYNEKWNEWISHHKEDYDTYKVKLVDELKIVMKYLQKISVEKDLQDKEYKKLKLSIKDVETELKNTISEQLIKINMYKEEIELLNNENQQLRESIQSKDLEIERLRQELYDVNLLLESNRGTTIQEIVDYDNCYNILQNFLLLNNIFYRKQEIIKKLEDIIYNGIGVFQNLTDAIKTNIITQFEIVKVEINKHIEFLDLRRYITSPNFELLKNKTTRNKVPKEFCDELTNILYYWNENKLNYRKQDAILTNIYEDLSGAVRIYVRIKPLMGTEQKSKTVYIQTVDTKKQKSITLDCSNAKNTKYQTKRSFGEFYGIFDESYKNEDIFTGFPKTIYDPTTLKIDLNSLEESAETISPGLYTTFKQVEDGYSVVLFGYGVSGSGKTFTLLGSKGVPGVLHYGLANLKSVSNIKLKYLFEQYYNSRRMNLNFGKIGGQICNLIREVPQMREFSKNENAEFMANIPQDINVNNLRIEDLYVLTEIIENYRIDKGRIKQTPNNPVSSRSNLYLIFEITFESGKTGYITIVDTAGRESPIDIFNTFIDGTKTTLGSIMAPSGGEKLVEMAMKDKARDIYTAKSIYEILREGFYNNECINHLTYYFNSKQYKSTKVILQSQNLEKYSIKNYYVNPFDEDTRINESNNCLMIPLLKFLDNLSSKYKTDIDWRPTKFITILTIRQEEKYCDQIYESLDFGQIIAST